MTAASKNANQNAIKTAKPAKNVDAQMAAMIAERDALLAERDALLAKQASKSAGRQPYCKVTEKGGVSFYLPTSRFPVTLYCEQWETVLACADLITAALAQPGVKRGGRNAAD